MKFLLILLLFVGLGFSSLYAQNEYTVVKVKGKITLTPGDKILKAGSKIKDNQTIVFESSGAVALVVHPKKGEFVLRQKTGSTSGNIGKALRGLVSNYLQLTKKTVATRSFSWVANKDIKKLFGPEPVAVKGDTSFVINSEKYPMSPTQNFYISYQYRGENINKNLEYLNDKLILSPKKLFMVDGNPVDEAEVSLIRLYYYRAATKTSEFICNPNFVFF